MGLLSEYQIDLRTLALTVIYLNLGRVAPSFPTSNRAHPSYWVFVDQVPPDGLLTPDHKIYFPNKVRWDVWQCVVVPVLARADGNVKIHGGTQAALQAEFDPELAEALANRVTESGVVPHLRTLRNAANAGYVHRQDYEPLILKVQRLLLDQLEACGMVVPPTTALDVNLNP